MPDKVAFATSNWKDKPGKPDEFSQSEWDAYNSSKFNGFPFPTIEKAQDNEPFEEWDKETYYQGVPSKSEERMISVLGDHYVKFTLLQLVKLHWRMKNGSFNVEYKGAKKNEKFCEEDRPDLSNVTHSSSDLSKNLENISNSSDIILSVGQDGTTTQGRFTSLDESFLATGGRSLSFNNAYDSLSFSILMGQQPVIKMGKDDYRVYFGCNHCLNKEGECKNFFGGGWSYYFEVPESISECNGCYSNGSPLSQSPISDGECRLLLGGENADPSFEFKGYGIIDCAVAQGTSSRDDEKNETYVAKSDLSCYGCYVNCTDEGSTWWFFCPLAAEGDYPSAECGNSFAYPDDCFWRYNGSPAAGTNGTYAYFMGAGSGSEVYTVYSNCIGRYPFDAAFYSGPCDP